MKYRIFFSLVFVLGALLLVLCSLLWSRDLLLAFIAGFNGIALTVYSVKCIYDDWRLEKLGKEIMKDTDEWLLEIAREWHRVRGIAFDEREFSDRLHRNGD